MSWRWPATTQSSLVALRTAPMRCSGGSRHAPGSASRPARAPRATATTTGRSSASTLAGVTLQTPGSAGCWCAAAAPPASWPTTTAGRPAPPPLAVLVTVAGRRWSIEERIKTSKGLCGLDAHQVRRWRSWYRWATLALLAHASLVVAALTSATRHPPPLELIPLTCNELQHLVAALLARPAADPAHRLRWSVWRRRQQARARTCHYRRQAAEQL
jgi:hypothetical protein